MKPLHIILTAFTCLMLSASCSSKSTSEKNSPLQPFLIESVTLHSQSYDSLANFCEKLYEFEKDADFSADPTYRLIVKNIDNTKKFLISGEPFSVMISADDSIMIPVNPVLSVGVNKEPTDEFGD